MDYKIGKIINYDNKKGWGNIVTNDKIYLFLSKDLEDNKIKNGDVVTFRGEKNSSNNLRAFFIKSYKLEQNKEGIKKR